MRIVLASGSPRRKERPMSDTIKQLCEMAEWFKENGDMETYRSVKQTAEKLLDFILYTSSQKNRKNLKKQILI